MSRYIHEDYMKTAVRINLLKKRIEMAMQILKKKKVCFDTIAFRGMSGAILGTSLALLLNKQIIMVRKSKQNTHSDYLVEGFRQSKKFLIVDDFVSSGNTAREIIRRVKQISPTAVCAGILEVTKQNRPRFTDTAHLKDIL